MKVPKSRLVALGLIFALRPGCVFKPEKSEKREATKLAKHCTEGSSACYDGCFKRQEGQICESCCFEELIVCGENHAYDFKKCDTVARELDKR